MKRRILSILTVLALCLTMLPAQALAADYTDNGLTITGGTEGTDYEVSGGGAVITVKTDTPLTLSGERGGNHFQLIVDTQTAYLTFDDLTIKNEANDRVGLTINSGSAASVTLIGDNTIQAKLDGSGNAVQMADDSHLYIDGEGSINIRGASNYYGGSAAVKGGNLHINGGTVTMVGGDAVEGHGECGQSFNGQSLDLQGGTLQLNDSPKPERGNITVSQSLAVGENFQLSIEKGASLTLGEGAVLTNSGTVVNNGAITGEGTITNTGIISNGLTGTVSGVVSGNQPVMSAPYLDGSGAEQSSDNATVVLADNTAWGANDDQEHWYVVNGDITISERIAVTGNVHLILADGCHLNATKGINVGVGNSLTIYAQSAGNEMGRLTAQGAAWSAGIGSEEKKSGEKENAGSITINGGAVTATGGSYGAAIGGGFGGRSGVITINGGTVTATAGWGGSGIGGGDHGGVDAVVINGGVVVAKSSTYGGSSRAIGQGDGGGGWDSNVSKKGGLVIEIIHSENKKEGSLYADTVITSDFTLAEEITLTIPEGKTLTIDEEATLTILGTLNVSGLIINNGTTVADSGTINKKTLSLSISVSAKTASSVTLTPVAGAEFSIDGTNYQDSNMFENLSPATRYTFHAKYKDSYLNPDFYDVQSSEASLDVYTPYPTPVADVLTFAGDGGNRTVTFDETLYEVCANSSFSTPLLSGADCKAGTSLYVRQKADGDIPASASVTVPVPLGDGADVVFEIGSRADFEAFATLVNSGAYDLNAVLTADVDMGLSALTISQYGGVFDGQGHTVSYMEYWGRGTDTPTITLGLFGTLSGTVENLALERCYIDVYRLEASSEGAVGLIAGQVTKMGVIRDCLVKNSTIYMMGQNEGAAFDVGIVAGENNGTIENVLVTGSSVRTYPSDGNSTGLLVGENNGAVKQGHYTASGDTEAVGGGSGTVTGGGSTTSEQINSGEVAYHLNDSRIPAVWGMNGGQSALGGDLVFRVTAADGTESYAAAGSTVSAGNTVQAGDDLPAFTIGEGTVATLKNDGGVTLATAGTVTISDGGETTTITLPSGGEVTPTGDGGVTVPEGTIVKTGDDGPEITVGPGNGGTVGGDGTVIVPEGGSVTIPDGEGGNTTITVPEDGGTLKPTKDGKVVVPGGSTVTTEDGSSETVPSDGGIVDPNTGEVTFNIHTVTFDSQGGSAVSNQTVTAGGKATKPSDPARSGYNFGGWFTNADCTAEYDFDAAVTADMTLYAKWNKVSSGSSSSSRKPSVSIGGGGNGGKVEADRNGNVTIIPADGYEIVAVTVNGKEVTVPADGKLTGLKWTDKVVVTFGEPPSHIPVSQQFIDVPAGAWYEAAVQYVVDNGIFNGTSENTFSPQEPMTRGMLATILYRLEKEPDIQIGDLFPDVAAGQYYSKAVAWAAARGIVNGYSDGTFGPDDPITREQLSVMLYRYAGSPVPPNLILNFIDAGKTSGYALDALCWMVEQGIVTGKGSGILDPTGTATRAEAAAMLQRFCESKK